MTRTLLVADLFCGAGGSSQGARRALARHGLAMKLVAVNHWAVAIETHQRNHPEARHSCVNLDAARPAELVPEGRLDLLMASPECTHHSRARGGKPVNDQSRMSAWHVVRWCTELRVRCLFIENVPEFVEWGPVDSRTGRPIKSRKGEYFKAWVAALESVGFKLEWRNVNCADHGDPTTRVRLLMLGRSDGKPIVWPEPTHSRAGGADLFGNATARWRPAREIIDWAMPGRSIFGRKKPLAPKTIARIYAGLVKFRWPEPFLVVLRQHMAARSIDDPLPTVTAKGTHVGLAQPFILPQRSDAAARSAERPTPTITGISRIGVVEPFIATVAHGSKATERDANTRRCRSLNDPLQTIHAQGGKFGLVEPFVLSQASGGGPRAVADPVPTIPAGGAHALVAPYYGSGSGETCGSVDAPLPTITAKARFGLVVPLTHSDASNRARSVEDPVPTITTANRGELAFITPGFGERKGQAPRAHAIDEPAPTIAAKGHLHLAEPGEGFDILFRMLQPHELAAAMGFSDEAAKYEFVGNKTEVTRQIGNAVPVNTSAAHVAALLVGAVPGRREYEVAAE